MILLCLRDGLIFGLLVTPFAVIFLVKSAVVPYRTFSLTWTEAIQTWNERKRLQNPTEFVWKTNMAAVVLFWDTNMAGVTSCKKSLY